MTTALCFDLDGTLVHWTRSHEAVMRDTLADHGLEADDEPESEDADPEPGLSPDEGIEHR